MANTVVEKGVELLEEVQGIMDSQATLDQYFQEIGIGTFLKPGFSRDIFSVPAGDMVLHNVEIKQVGFYPNKMKKPQEEFLMKGINTNGRRILKSFEVQAVFDHIASMNNCHKESFFPLHYAYAYDSKGENISERFEVMVQLAIKFSSKEEEDEAWRGLQYREKMLDLPRYLITCDI